MTALKEFMDTVYQFVQNASFGVEKKLCWMGKYQVWIEIKYEHLHKGKSVEIYTDPLKCNNVTKLLEILQIISYDSVAAGRSSFEQFSFATTNFHSHEFHNTSCYVFNNRNDDSGDTMIKTGPGNIFIPYFYFTYYKNYQNWIMQSFSKFVFDHLTKLIECSTLSLIYSREFICRFVFCLQRYISVNDVIEQIVGLI